SSPSPSPTSSLPPPPGAPIGSNNNAAGINKGANNNHILHRRDASTSSFVSSASGGPAHSQGPLLTSNSAAGPQAPPSQLRLLDGGGNGGGGLAAVGADLKQAGHCSGSTLEEHGGAKVSGRRLREGDSEDGDEAEEEEEDEGEEEEGDEEEEEEAACDIGLMERLIRSHPVWFLPGIQRAGAVHLLQGKEEGNFVVRQSSQPDTMAISVRLPRGKGPYIEHYLVQAVPASTPSPTTPSAPPPHPSCGGQLQSPPPQQLSLESSDNRFDSIPALIGHYSQCCDELPVQLTLPRAIREARNRQQLSSLALLGQEFWRYPMANPRPERAGILDTAVADGLTPPSSHHSSLSSFGSGGNHSGSVQSNGGANAGLHAASKTTASSPDSCDMGGSSNIVLNLSPLSGEGPTLSSFRGGTSASSTLSHPPATSSAATPTSTCSSNTATNPSPPRGPRPTPPNTLNIVSAASPSPSNALVTPPGVARVTSPSSAGSGGKALSPPPPPPRWAKPAFAAAAAAAAALSGQNFTVTTTVTFSVNQLNGALVNYDPDSINSPPAPAHVEVQLTPPPLQSQRAGDAGVTSPVQVTPTGEGGRGKSSAAARREKRMAAARAKESRHYRESDILDSPTVYYRSSMADKASDYEDIWGPSPRESTPPVDRLGGAGKVTTPELLTFKPRPTPGAGEAHAPEDCPTTMVTSTLSRPPDLLERLNAASSVASLNRIGSPLSPLPTSPDGQAGVSPPKHGSPFYAEPADAITGRLTTSPAQEAAAIVAATAAVPRRRQRGGRTGAEAGGRAGQQLQQRLASHRHSDPTMLNWAAASASGAPRRVVGGLERIDSNDELMAGAEGAEGRMRLHAHLHRLHSPPRPPQQPATPPALSSSVDNLNLLRTPRGPPGRGKPVQPPRVGGGTAVERCARAPAPKPAPSQQGRRRNVKGGLFHDTSWAVDSSWEFIGNGEEVEDDQDDLEGASDGDALAGDAQSDAEDAEDADGAVSSPTERRFPPDGDLPTPDDEHADGDGRRLTVHHLIVKKMPHLYALLFESERPAPAVPAPAASAGGAVGSRISAYDNVEGRTESCCANGEAAERATNQRQHLSAASQASDEDTRTVFSEPWDSSRWEGLLNGGGEAAMQAEAERAVSSFLSDAESLVHLSAAGPPLISDAEDETMVSSVGCEYSSPGGGCFGRAGRKAALRGRITDPLISPPTGHHRTLRGGGASIVGGCIGWGAGGAAGGAGGASIRAYALHLAADSSTTFAQNIENFISCTRESRETSPQIVMRNMRQFMSGMKNYLVKHGEREFEKEVEKERLKLKANEFLNLDAILEGVMHRLVVRPLRQHLYCLFVDEYTRSGAIQLLAENIQFARSKAPNELGIRPRICLPSEQSLERICQCLQRLQEVDSPLEKLEHLLCCISAIFNAVKGSSTANGQSRGGLTLGADDLLPLLVWVLVRSGMVGAEIEAEYMFGLLHPALLSAGEGAYYLTTLSSAVHVLKSFRAFSEAGGICGSGGPMGISGQDGGLCQTGMALPLCTLDAGPLSEFRAVLRIVVPDEAAGSLATKTLPVRPNMTARDVCRIAAHKARVTNPQDYGLFKLVDGEETLLCDLECPQEVRALVTQQGKHCVFAYKRIDAKIAWPRTASPPK
ncbi:protein sprint, partial [Hetaerina americana]|uniref:protein sprint n=1 Tax=Hetaerina americana TaxID=62018 RepID=UPI003A7F4D13